MNLRRLTRGERVELSIEKMAVGGRAVARLDGVVVFVAGAAPGDRVNAEITLVKKNFAEAEMVEVLKAGPSRVPAPCPVFGRCGGCSWQHLAYAEQLVQKRLLVSESLRKMSGFSEFHVAETVPSPQQFRYRNRIQLHRGPGNEIGFHARRENRVIDVKDCLIADEPLASELKKIRDDLHSGRADVPERFELKMTPSGRVTLDANDEPGFAQVNSSQNDNLVAMVLSVFEEHGGVEPPASIWDVYAGSGNFTFPLAKRFASSRVTGVELHPGAAALGTAAARDLGLADRVKFVAQAAEAWLAQATVVGPTAVLLDPPRTGCEPSTVARLAALPLDFLVYVSCHPVTLARDLRVFHERGWTLASVTPIDMFPQTDHIETVVCLRPPARRP